NTLRAAEEAIWGGPVREENGNARGGQSPVQVVIEIVSRGSGISRCLDSRGQEIHIGDPGSLLSYGAFPLRETRRQRDNQQTGKSQELLIGVRFRMTISYTKNIEHEVQSALWAWETFGGIGARTRRGFGAIKLEICIRHGIPQKIRLPASSEPADLKDWFQEFFSLYVCGGTWHPHIPHLNISTEPVTKALPDGFQVGKQNFVDFLYSMLQTNKLSKTQAEPFIAPLVAWYYPIYKLQVFRQSRRYSQRHRNPYGRSYWPEPDEIRHRTVGFRGDHSNRLTFAPKFPRAVFGLPIVFKFKDEKIDPPQTTLQGSQHDRMSSRLILRPIACADGSYVAAATVLAGPELPPGGLILQGATNSGNIDTSPLTRKEANFPPLNGQTDVLQAFLDTL
ncbi:RAMP superfamily CRISPR-associated protein, partial [Roseiflexus sp.]|uniref:RAMP superfamily CRISPR-associated protein n=1 Tax=Roseiflexus sp. TaxID=2562120 RepID=UPI00398B2FB8